MTALIDFLGTMPYWYWFVFAGILLICEIASGTTYLLWPAASAAFVGLLDMGPMDGMWEWQLAIFALMTFALTIFVTPYARDWLHNQRTDNELLNQRGARQIGKLVRAHGDFVDGSGKVKLDDTVWLAKADVDEEIVAGTQLVVKDVKGVTLIVVRQ